MLNVQQASVAKAMLHRGDAQHDIAAFFGVNAGRIAEIKTGEKFRDVAAASVSALPPTGKQRRFVDPNSTPDEQYKHLRELIDNPPENSRVIDVTPELAGLVLDKLNSNNRGLRPANIKRFAEAMSSGNWALTGDTIKFSRSRLLLDGQNRLASGVRSGVKFRTYVVFGIADDAFTRIDSGAARTGADTFKRAGIPYYGVAAPATRWLMIGTDRGRKVENEELLNYWLKAVDTDRMEKSCRDAIAVGRVLPTGALAAYLYQFHERNAPAADRFAKELIDRKNGPRKLIEKVQRLKQANMGRLNELQTNALLIQAWNKYRAGQPITAQSLNWNETLEYPVID